jgi:hypothetical protein
LTSNQGIPGKAAQSVAEKPDGTRVPFLAYPTPHFDEKGDLTGVVNVLVDITGRKGAAIAEQKFEGTFGGKVNGCASP